MRTIRGERDLRASCTCTNPLPFLENIFVNLDFADFGGML
jgi:hypothetical protein